MTAMPIFPHDSCRCHTARDSTSVAPRGPARTFPSGFTYFKKFFLLHVLCPGYLSSGRMHLSLLHDYLQVGLGLSLPGFSAAVSSASGSAFHFDNVIKSSASGTGFHLEDIIQIS